MFFELTMLHFALFPYQMPALVGHYMWLGYVVLHMPCCRAVVFLLTAQMLCGLFQAWIIGLGHNGMASYDAETRPDFWQLQVQYLSNMSAASS